MMNREDISLCPAILPVPTYIGLVSPEKTLPAYDVFGEVVEGSEEAQLAGHQPQPPWEAPQIPRMEMEKMPQSPSNPSSEAA